MTSANDESRPYTFDKGEGEPESEASVTKEALPEGMISIDGLIAPTFLDAPLGKPESEQEVSPDDSRWNDRKIDAVPAPPRPLNPFVPRQGVPQAGRFGYPPRRTIENGPDLTNLKVPMPSLTGPESDLKNIQADTEKLGLQGEVPPSVYDQQAAPTQETQYEVPTLNEHERQGLIETLQAEFPNHKIELIEGSVGNLREHLQKRLNKLKEEVKSAQDEGILGPEEDSDRIFTVKKSPDGPLMAEKGTTPLVGVAFTVLMPDGSTWHEAVQVPAGHIGATPHGKKANLEQLASIVASVVANWGSSVESQIGLWSAAAKAENPCDL